MLPFHRSRRDAWIRVIHGPLVSGGESKACLLRTLDVDLAQVDKVRIREVPSQISSNLVFALGVLPKNSGIA